MIGKNIGSILNRILCCSSSPDDEKRHRIDDVEMDSEVSGVIESKKNITAQKCNSSADNIEKNNRKENLVASKTSVSSKTPLYKVEKKKSEKGFVSTSMVKMKAAKKARNLSSVDRCKEISSLIIPIDKNERDIVRRKVHSVQSILEENKKTELRKTISCKEVDELLKMYNGNSGEESESSTETDEAVEAEKKKKNIKGAISRSSTTENEGHTSSEEKEKETGSVDGIEEYLLKDSIETETQSLDSETEISCSIDFYDKKEFSKILLKTIKKNLKEHQETSRKENTGG